MIIYKSIEVYAEENMRLLHRLDEAMELLYKIKDIYREAITEGAYSTAHITGRLLYQVEKLNNEITSEERDKN